ncbi:MAG: enoyl-CoA hydratase/isomerase family protein [Phycisphaerales bacterium]|jgi:enoyl-CoA hydratase/carnithine racemase
MIRSETRDHVRSISLCRGEKRNALQPAMLDSLLHELRVAASDPAARVVLLLGEGEVFCSGFDMKLVHNDAAALPALLASLSACVRVMRRAPQPVVIAAHGGAIAGGCALLSGGDMVVTDEHAKLGYPVLRLGISPAVNAAGLIAHVGAGIARERMLDTSAITRRDALRVGLAHRCVATPADVLPEALRIAAELAAKPPHALAATKALLASIDRVDADEPFDHGLAVSMSLVGSDQQRERVAALWATPTPTKPAP